MQGIWRLTQLTLKALVAKSNDILLLFHMPLRIKPLFKAKEMNVLNTAWALASWYQGIYKTQLLTPAESTQWLFSRIYYCNRLHFINFIRIHFSLDPISSRWDRLFFFMILQLFFAYL